MRKTNYLITVDDEAPVRDVLSKIAKKIDPECIIYEAENGIEGYNQLESLSKKNIFGNVVMITDHGMPNMMGLDMLRKIRDGKLATKFGDNLFIYMVFSPSKDYSEEIGKIAVKECLVRDYFLKPAIPKIRSVLGEHFT